MQVADFAKLFRNYVNNAAQVHNRMPAVLTREAEQAWLDTIIAPEHVLSLLTPYPANQMRMYEISPRVNRATEDTQNPSWRYKHLETQPPTPSAQERTYHAAAGRSRTARSTVLIWARSGLGGTVPFFY